jgi:nucleoside-diphosphate-sugar epimerase
VISRSPIVVTGAGGWLGRPLVGALAAEAGEQMLRCLVRSWAEAGELETAAPNAETVVGDVCDPATLDRLFAGSNGATVFHAAGVIHPAGRTREFFDINVGGTELVLDRARRFGAGRVVFVSSNSPFGVNASPLDVFDEEAPYRPYMAYGQSKVEAERLVVRASARGYFDTVIVRCPWFYGPYQPPRQTRFFSAIRRGRFPLVGDGSNRRSMVYIDNLVQGLLLAAESDRARGRAYWIADLEPYPMRYLLETVREAMRAEGLQVSARQPRVPSRIGDLAEMADRFLQERGKYVQAVHVLSEMNKTIACTTKRAEAELGYRPAVGLLEGMRRSVRWVLEHGGVL